MKRWGIRISVFLLLGAIVNVAVAWGWLALDHAEWPPWIDGSTGYWPSEQPVMAIDLYRSTGRCNVASCHFVTEIAETLVHNDDYGAGAAAVPSWSFIRRLSSDELNSGVEYADVAWGFPLLSLHSCIQYDYISSTTGDLTMDIERTIGGITPRWFADESACGWWAIPLTPIWPGFAIDTVFYAAILWMLFAAPFALRRWRRNKRGLCPACGYDLRGNPATVCPECGKGANP